MKAALRLPGPRRDRTAGFLLTETLATFTISAFVLLGLVSASSVLLRNVDRSVARIQDVDDLGQTMKAIERDLSGLQRARWNGYEPQDFIFQGGPNSLFFARAQSGLDGSRAERVIALREIAGGGGTRLMRGEARLLAQTSRSDELRFGPQHELGTGTARLRFYYLMPEGAKGKHGRLREWPPGRLLPAAIVVEAVDRDTGRLIMTTRVTIRANADIGCLPAEQDKATPASASASAAVATNASGAVGGDDARPPSIQGAPVTSQGDVEQASDAPPRFCGRLDAGKTDKDRQTPAAPSADLAARVSP